MQITVSSIPEMTDQAPASPRKVWPGEEDRKFRFRDTLSGVSRDAMEERRSTSVADDQAIGEATEEIMPDTRNAGEFLFILSVVPPTGDPVPSETHPEQITQGAKQQPSSSPAEGSRINGSVDAQHMVPARELTAAASSAHFSFSATLSAQTKVPGSTTVSAAKEPQDDVKAVPAIPRGSPRNPEFIALLKKGSNLERETPEIAVHVPERLRGERLLPAVEPMPALTGMVTLLQTAAASSSPALQIIASLSETSVATPTMTPMLFQAAPQSGEVRVLRMTLRPDDLGDVEITLRLSGGEIRVHIAVATPAAAEALQRDRTLLEDRLGSLLPPGAQPSLTIMMQVPESREPQPPLLPQRGNAEGSSPGFGSQQDGNGSRSSSTKEGARARWHERDDDENETGPRRIASGLVL